MKIIKILKYLFITLTLLFAILIGTFIGLIFYIKPEQFKPRIEQYISENTEYNISINGPLSWSLASFLPSIKSSNIILTKNNTQINITDLNASIHLIPLFKKNIEFDTINLSQVQIDNLVIDEISLEKINFKQNIFGAKTLKLNNKSANINLTANNVTFNKNTQTIAGDFDLNIKNNNLNGKANLNLFEPNKINFYFPNLSYNSYPINLQGEYITNNNTGNFHLTANKLKIAELNNNIEFNNLDTRIVYYNNTLNLKPLNFQLLGTNYNSQVIINFNRTPLSWTIYSQATAVDIESLLKLFNSKQANSIKGNLDFNLQLRTIGLTELEVYQNLNGTGQIKVTGGDIRGFDLNAILNQAAYSLRGIYAAFKGLTGKPISNLIITQAKLWKEPLWSDTKHTPFDLLTSSFTIKNGIVFNQDLEISHKDYDILGHGSYDLNNSQINYRLNTKAKTNNFLDLDPNSSNEMLDFVRSHDLAVHIIGNINKPNVHLDKQAFLASSIIYFQQKTANKIIKKVLPGSDEDKINKITDKITNKLLESIKKKKHD